MTPSSPLVGARARVLLLTALIAVFGLIASQIQVSTNLADALPEDADAGRAFRDIARFSLLDTLVIEVDGTGRTEEELGAAVDQLGEALTARPHFASVRYRYGMADGLALRKAAAPHLALLGDGGAFAERLTAEGMTAALIRARDRLSSPAGAMLARGIDTDPLDLGGAFTEDVLGLGMLRGVSLRGGHLVSEDGHHALILARANTPALGTTLDSPLVTDIRADLAATPLPADWIGSHRFAAEAADQITREVQRAVTAGIVLLVGVFLLAFRSVRPLLGALPALIVGGAAAGAAAGLRSPIHGVALAFGGAMAGLGVDYWIHLYLTGIRDGVPATRKERFEVGLAALHHLLPAYGMSVAATLTAFGMLATSSYAAVADLAWIGIGTASGALLSVLLGGPALFALVARPGDQVPTLPVPLRAPGWLAAVLLVGLAGLSVAALGTRFDGNPRSMDARLPASAALERSFQDRYGGEATTGLVVVEAPTLDAALAGLDTAVAGLHALGGLSIRSPLPFLPAPAVRAARLKVLADGPALEARFATAADEVGFAADALLPGLRTSLASTAPPRLDTWAGTPAADVLDRTVRVDAAGAAVAALVSALSPEALARAQQEVALTSGASARFVHPAGVAEDGAKRVRTELLTRSGLGLLLVLAYMALRYRDFPRFFAAALPSLAAVAGTLGTLALLGQPLTPVSGPAMVLVLGLAFDQGVFLVEADKVSRSAWLSTRAAILVALCTAFAGFAGLCAASYPAVFGVGIAISLGIAFTGISAFFIVPAILTDEGQIVARRIGRRVAFTVTVALSLDALLALRGRVRPPPAPTEFRTYTLDERSPTDRVYGPNRLLRSHGVWVVRAEGTAYEIGRATGLLAGDLRARNEASVVAEFFAHVTNPLVQYALARGVPLLADAMTASIPAAYLEELRGYTDVGDDHMAWLAPQYTRKLCYHAIHDVGQAMVDSPLLACTGFIAGGERTTDGHWLLARNFDFDGGRFFDEDKAVVLVKREGVLPFVHVAIVGLSGVVSGLNTEGIGVAVFAGASDARVRVSEPMIFILREILERAHSIEEARIIVDERRGFVSEGLLVVDGKSGEGAVFEVTPDQVNVLHFGRDGEQAIALSNHFRTPDLVDDVANQRRMAEGTSVARLARMEELTAKEAGPIDLARAVALLRDRGGVRGRTLPDGHESAINADIASHGVVIDATARTLTVSMSPNLSGGFVRFSLDALLAGDLEGEQVAAPDDPDRTLRVHEARRLRRLAAGVGPSAAEPLLRSALALDPGAPDLLIALGEARLAQGDPAGARTALEAAIAAPPARAKELRHAQDLLETAR